MDHVRLSEEQSEKVLRLLIKHIKPQHLLLPQTGQDAIVKVYDTGYRQIGTITVAEAFKL